MITLMIRKKNIEKKRTTNKKEKYGKVNHDQESVQKIQEEKKECSA